jgi:hypothetical protein
LGQAPDAQSGGWIFVLSVSTMVIVLTSGLIFFRRTERTFADII